MVGKWTFDPIAGISLNNVYELLLEQQPEKFYIKFNEFLLKNYKTMQENSAFMRLIHDLWKRGDSEMGCAVPHGE